MASVNELGLKVEDFGTHSFRKGVATYTAGFIGGPSIISIFLRAGWSLGQVQDRYLTYADGGDQFCGRVACGLSLNDGDKFSVLPPHFDGQFEISHEYWQTIAPGYDDYPSGFQKCLPYLLASIVYHLQWICEKDDDGNGVHVANNHPFFQSRAYLFGNLPSLLCHVLPLNATGRCDKTTMTATGIPTFIDMSRQLSKLVAENKALTERIEVMEDNLIKKLPVAIASNIKENFHVEGIQQLTRNDLTACITEALALHLKNAASFHSRAAESESEKANTGDENSAEGQKLTMTWNGYACWYWRYQLGRPVPLTFEFPLTNVKTVCDIFHFGLPQDNIRPFRFIENAFVFQRHHQQYFCKARVVYDLIVDTIIVLGDASAKEVINSLNIVDWNASFSKAFMHLVELLYWTLEVQIKKPGEVSFMRFYDLYRLYENEMQNL